MQLLKANGYETCAVGRLDMVTADDWHDPVQVAGCADRVLGSASGGPGNYFKGSQGHAMVQRREEMGQACRGIFHGSDFGFRRRFH